ncbi:hypothetical protein PHLCEN_2v3198 [Hermanssonia centrifuga]|uniref:Uncharacterized protein n=1 Tax=Hermanssonia centrifuga TaxID=98765 RepID=A0A2R6R0W1_9APHY|nr:hypothetical protein PHLCEN_2v3198 [Hermanssonia centrifuga]
MLPDDQSFRMIQLGQRTVILSVSEAGVQIGQGTDIGPQVTDSVNGYYIFAQKVTVVDSFSVTLSKDSVGSKSSDPIAAICTSDLSLESSGLVTLDVSGAAGIDNDTGAQRGPTINGKPAGSLCVYIENTTSEAVHSLVLKARGGDGGDTREKQGTAGDGGKGGQVQYIAYSYLTDVYLKLDFFARNMSWNRDLPGNTPLTPDHPIVVYLQQAVDLADALSQSNSISEDIRSTVDMSQPIANICAKAQTLQPPTIDNARDAVWEVRQAVRAQLDSDDLAITIYVEGGQGGSPEPSLSGGERGQPGQPGQRGNILSTEFLYRIDADLLRTQTMVFVHPEHCQMLYERAMTYWYFGRTSTAMDLLSRLLFRTSFLPLKSTDALYQAYEKQEKVLGCTNSVAGLVDVRTRAMQQYSILLTGQVDFYGHSVFWVPRVAYSDYNKYIDGAMDVYIHLEQSYINYCAALDQQQQTNDAIQQSAAKIDGTLATMQTERVTLVSSLQDLESKIKAADPVVEQKHRDFAAAYQEFEDIFNKPPPHGITPRQLFNAAITMTSLESTSKVVTTAEAIDQLWSDFNGDPDHIQTDSGVPVNKEYLMGQIKRSIVTGLDDFTSELTTAELNGEFQVDGRLPKFVMEEGQLNEILSQYSNAAFAEAGQELVDAYDDFIKALSSRNDDIVAYNAVIRLIVSQSQEMAKLKAMKELAGKHTMIDAECYLRMPGHE